MIVVGIPGKFMLYLDGSSMMQDSKDHLDAACRHAIAGGIRRRHGHGSYVLVTFADREVAGVLADLADACIVANVDEGDQAEVRAARLVLERLARFGVTPIA